MRKDREQANILRKSGLSYSEIISQMKVPRSTLSVWFHDQSWSAEIAKECVTRARRGAAMRFMVLNTIRGSRLKKVYEEAKQDAVVDFDALKYHPLFIAGVMAYWTHGDKSSKHKVSFSTSDPALIRIWAIFLAKLCSVSKFKIYLLLDSNSNEEESKKFLVEKCGLKYENFGKTGVSKGKSKASAAKNDFPHGICNIVLTSAYLKSKILKWIELMAVEIGEEQYEHI